MTRGGRHKDRSASERRCIATGTSQPAARLVRFVLGPDGRAVPDVACKLPGRGVWVSATADAVGTAVRKKLFSRAFRQQVAVDPDLPALVEDLLAQRLVDLVSLARKAGQAVTGAEKVRARLLGEAAVLLAATDGADDGKRKLAALATAARGDAVTRIELLTAAELGLAFGREFAIHSALDAGGFAERVCAEALRLAGFREPGRGLETAKTDLDAR